MQEPTIMDATYTELEAGLDAFVEAVSDLLTADCMAQESESGTRGGLASLSRAKWLRLAALEGESLRAWIGAEVERAHATILEACERIGCVLPDDQPEPIRKVVALAARVADNLLAVTSRADLRRMSSALHDAKEGLYDALPDLEPQSPALPSWTADELRNAVASPPRSGAISKRHFARLLREAGLGGKRGQKDRRFGPSEVRLLIEAVRKGRHHEPEVWVRGWTALLIAAKLPR